MTEKEIIKWLSRAYWHQIKIEKMQSYRTVVQSMADGCKAIDYSKISVQGGVPQSLEDSVLRLIEIDNKIAGEILRYQRAVDEITEAINKIEDSRLSTLLYMRYVKGERWERIAVELSYGWTQVHRLHHKALTEVAPFVLTEKPAVPTVRE